MTYNVSEATASRIVRHVENCLIKSNLFNLQNKLPKCMKNNLDVVIVDVTEIPVQRPKKNKRKVIAVRKKHVRLKFRQ